MEKKYMDSNLRVGEAYREGLQGEILRKKIDMAKKFTAKYKEYMNSHVAVREAMCLSEQYPALCKSIKDYDLIAGRLYFNFIVGFGLEAMLNNGIDIIKQDKIPDSSLSDKEKELREHVNPFSCGFSFDYSVLEELIQNPLISNEEREELKEIQNFWYSENMVYKFQRSLPSEIKENLGRVSEQCQYAIGFFRVCCISVDFDKLLQLGIPGMKNLILLKMVKSKSEGIETGLYEGMLIALDILVNVCKHYENECLILSGEVQDDKRRDQLITMAGNLKAISENKPATLRQAIQLFWLYNLLADTLNYGRMDEYLGDFYATDIENKTETEESAKEVISSLWRIISEQANEGCGSYRFNTRIILGGKGRRNTEYADRFALAALEVTKKMKVCEPMVTLRFYKGQNIELFEKALECIKEGCVNPTLYNDDASIPWVAKSYNISMEEAESYIPEGCGEIMIDHRSVGSPNNIINYTTALDLVLHNGFHTEIGECRGLSNGELEDFKTFDQLLDAFKKQVDFTNEIFAKRHALEHKVEAENAAFLFLSMLTDDCIERGKSIFDGGARYTGGIIETFGLTNAADSLYAIKELVYERKVMSLRQIVEMTDKNFDGYEAERALMLSLPKFGNDIDEVDSLYTEISNFVCNSAYEKAKSVGLHFFLNCNLNPGGANYGMNTKASADGRLYGEGLAIGNAPSAGRDKSGITALLNSMVKPDMINSGYVHNLKVSPSMFSSENIGKFKTLLSTFFSNGGNQVMVTVLNKDDLRNAMKEPEKYTNIMVRVGGWTAKFVELPNHIQVEILNRTLYC